MQVHSIILIPHTHFDSTHHSYRSPDLIVEVSHPSIVAQYGLRFLRTADFMVSKLQSSHVTVFSLLTLQIGSPTALADRELSTTLTEEARHSHGLYVAVGALWGAQDIQKMADGGTLKVGSFQ